MLVVYNNSNVYLKEKWITPIVFWTRENFVLNTHN